MAAKATSITGGTKAATTLTTALTGWQQDIDVGALTDVVLHLTHVNSAAATITLQLSSAHTSGGTYYPLARITSAGVISDGTVTWAVSADDTQAVPLNVAGTKFLRIEAKANASSGDTLACVVTGGVRK